ncbi:MAG: PH domain-containing protein [Patescibacteria group bacterium]
MDNSYYSKNLNEGEEMIETVRCHPIIMIGPLIAAGLFVILDFFFLVLLFSQGWWGAALFFAVLMVVLTLGFRTWVIWSRNVFIITNRRVIDVDQHGFFSKTVSECNYEKIQDVSYTIKGVIATIFKFGSINIQTAGNVANLELNFLKNPARVQEMITDQQRKASLPIEEDKEITKENLLYALRQKNQGVDEEALNKIYDKK